MSNLPPPGAVVAVDTETSGLHVDDGARIACFSVAWRDWRGRLISRALPLAQAGARPISNERWLRWLQRLKKCRLVWWNMKFDLHFFAVGREGYAGCDLSHASVWDGMLATAVLEPLKSAGLKETAERHFGSGARAEQAALQKALAAWARKNKVTGVSGRFDLLDWSIVEPYATKDAELTLLLCELQHQWMEEGDGWARPIISKDVELAKVLFRMERRGIAYDAAASRKSARRLARRILSLEKALPFRPTPAGARAWFFGKVQDGGLGLIPHRVTENGTISVDAGVVAKLVQRGVPGAAEFAEYQKLEKAYGSWYQGFADKTGADGRLRTVFSLSQVVSNRLSSGRCNLQALPHDYRLLTDAGVATVRSFFHAKPGYTLWELDLSQAEVRVAAAVSNCSRLRTAIVAGDSDLHGATARTVFGVGPDDQQWFRFRQISKRLNFAMIYGAGAGKLAATLSEEMKMPVSEAEARVWKTQYDLAFPELKRAYYQAQAFCEVNGYVVLAGGRFRWYNYAFEQPRTAFNQVIQGGVAEMMKRWMLAIDSDYPGWMLLQIHDSIVMEMPDSFTPDRVARLGERIFEEEFKIPFQVGIKQWGAK